MKALKHLLKASFCDLLLHVETSTRTTLQENRFTNSFSYLPNIFKIGAAI